MSKLTDTQLIILSAASQRDDRGVELPANVKGEAARRIFTQPRERPFRVGSDQRAARVRKPGPKLQDCILDFPQRILRQLLLRRKEAGDVRGIRDDIVAAL